MSVKASRELYDSLRRVRNGKENNNKKKEKGNFCVP